MHNEKKTYTHSPKPIATTKKSNEKERKKKKIDEMPNNNCAWYIVTVSYCQCFAGYAVIFTSYSLGFVRILF